MTPPAAEWGRFSLFLGLHAIAALIMGALLVDGALGFVGEQRRRIDDAAGALAQAASWRNADARMAAVGAAELETAQQWFLQGRTQSLLNADLLTSLRQRAEKHGVVFASVATLADRELTGLRFAGVRIEFTAPGPNAAALLLDLDEGDRFLFSGRTRLSVAEKSDQATEVVSVSVDVYGATRWRPR